MKNTICSCQSLKKLELPLQIFYNYSNVKFRENSCSGSRFVPCGWADGWTDRRTERHDEAKSHFSQFYERA